MMARSSFQSWPKVDDDGDKLRKKWWGAIFTKN